MPEKNDLAEKIADKLAQPAAVWLDPELKGVKELLGSHSLSKEEQQKIMEDACAKLQEKGALPVVVGDWGEKHAWFIDRDRDGTIHRKELLEAEKDERATPIDKAMIKAMLDQYSYIQSKSFQLETTEEDNPFKASDLKWYAERMRWTESVKYNLGSASDSQKKSLEALQAFGKQQPTAIERAFGSPDRIVATFDTDHDGKVSADEILKGCERLKIDSSNRESLQKAFLTILSKRPKDAPATGMTSRELISHRREIEEQLKK
jgi:Ca2+-binding EF-hand superfamily protein